MEIQLDTLISIATLLLGGGGGAFFTWRWQRAKARAEAKSAEAEAQSAEVSATKEMQDVYQQLIADIKNDRDEQKSYINELKEDRRHLREDRDDLRKRQDSLEETVRTLQDDVARNGRMVKCMRPLVCGRRNCPDRVSVDISETGEIKTKRSKKGGNDGNSNQ